MAPYTRRMKGLSSAVGAAAATGAGTGQGYASSTSELIDWISALLRSCISMDKIEAHIPFVGALLKKEQDVDALTR